MGFFMTDFFLGVFGKKMSICSPFHIGQLCYITFEVCSRIKMFLPVSPHPGQMLCYLSFIFVFL